MPVPNERVRKSSSKHISDVRLQGGGEGSGGAKSNAGSPAICRGSVKCQAYISQVS